MVHRDVKPANCLFVDGAIETGRLWSSDGGQSPDVSAGNATVHAARRPHGRSADVYAAGLVIYEMITGLPADCFPRPGEAAVQSAEDAILCVLNHLALRACQQDPLQRFQDARQMLRELEARQREADTGGAGSRRQVIAAAVGLLMASGLAGAAFWSNCWRRAHVALPRAPLCNDLSRRHTPEG